MNMSRIGLLANYVMDLSNMLQVATATVCATIAAVAHLIEPDERSTPQLRAAVAFSTCLVWVNVVSEMRVLNQRLAAFIGALTQTFVDLKWFLVR